MKYDGNQISSCELAFNAIYTSPGWPKSHFFVGPCKIWRPGIVLMSTVAIPNIDIKGLDPEKWVATRELSNRIKYEITRVEHVESQTLLLYGML